jgi:archaellum biogenesis ATPase FlaH
MFYSLIPLYSGFGQGGCYLTSDHFGPLQSGGTYIVDETSPGMSVAVFEGHVQTGRAGLYITGEPPDLARHRLSLPDKVEYAWVTDVSAPNALKPAMIDQINARRERFLEKHPRTILLLDIFTPLVSANDFGNVFKFFSYIRDDTHHRDSITVITLDKRSLEDAQYRKMIRLARVLFSEENPPDSFLPAQKLVEGHTYVMKSGGKRAYRIAAEAARADRQLMCVVRTFPDSLREQSLMPAWTEFRWLSKASHPDVMRPDRPAELFQRLSEFMCKDRTVLLLDGIDLLVAEVGFNELYRMVTQLKDLARLNKGNLIVLVPPSSLTPGEFRKLAAECELI